MDSITHLLFSLLLAGAFVIVAPTVRGQCSCGSDSHAPRPYARFRVGSLEGGAVRRRQPRYPSAAQRRGIEGTVVVEAVVTTDGRVTWSRAITGPAELHRAAEAAACDYRFTPILHNGRPEVTVGTLTFTFELPRNKLRLP